MKSDAKLNNIRHSLAHLLAMAVLEEDDKAKLAIGPTIQDGFYYDFEFNGDYKISHEHLKELEKKIKHYIKQNIEFKHFELSPAEAKEKFKDEPYKLELIDEIVKRGEKLSFYQSGDLWTFVVVDILHQQKKLTQMRLNLQKSPAHTGEEMKKQNAYTHLWCSI